MQAAMNTQAKAYSPSTSQARRAALAYVERANTWSATYGAACKDLASFLRTNVKAKALGFVASDALNMSAFGVVFESAPGAGFIAVPGAVADRVREHGLRGEAYFPDMVQPLGKQVMARLAAVSRAAEQRPLLNAVAGVRSVALQDGTVVLSRAVQTPQGVAIYAAASALTPSAEVVPFEVTVARATAEEKPYSAPRVRM
jgi:hypothetical protein